MQQRPWALIHPWRWQITQHRVPTFTLSVILSDEPPLGVNDRPRSATSVTRTLTPKIDRRCATASRTTRRSAARNFTAALADHGPAVTASGSSTARAGPTEQKAQ